MEQVEKRIWQHFATNDSITWQEIKAIAEGVGFTKWLHIRGFIQDIKDSGYIERDHSDMTAERFKLIG